MVGTTLEPDPKWVGLSVLPEGVEGAPNGPLPPGGVGTHTGPQAPSFDVSLSGCNPVSLGSTERTCPDDKVTVKFGPIGDGKVTPLRITDFSEG